MWYSFFPDSPIRYNAWTAIVGTEIGSQGTEVRTIHSVRHVMMKLTIVRDNPAICDCFESSRHESET